jgi:hypothetical protein
MVPITKGNTQGSFEDGNKHILVALESVVDILQIFHSFLIYWIRRNHVI